MSSVISTFQVAGMTCSACQKVVAKKLNRISGVSEVLVDKESGQAKVSADHNITYSEVKTALAGTPYLILE